MMIYGFGWCGDMCIGKGWLVMPHMAAGFHRVGEGREETKSVEIQG